MSIVAVHMSRHANATKSTSISYRVKSLLLSFRHPCHQVNVDNCANPFGGTQSVIEYTRFHDALVKVGKPMV